MKVEQVKLSRLVPNTGQVPGLPINPRQWTASDIDKIANSLLETPELFEARPIIAYPLDEKTLVIYNYHKRIIDDTQENKRFAEKFSKVLEEYRFPTGFQASLYKDIENADLLSRATQVFIKQYYPAYKNIDEIRVYAQSAENSFMSFPS